MVIVVHVIQGATGNRSATLSSLRSLSLPCRL